MTRQDPVPAKGGRLTGMQKKSFPAKSLVRVFLLIAALVFLVYGFKRGEWEIVLHKAVNICFECIGLG